MAYELVDAVQLNNDLLDIADAIRDKSQGQAPLLFPSEFISEIQSIPTGPSELLGYMCYEGVKATATSNQTVTFNCAPPTSQDSNSFCMDENGNTFQNGNGAFQYSLNGGAWTNITNGMNVSVASGGVLRVRFFNTTTNKPFGFCTESNGSHDCYLSFSFIGPKQFIVTSRPNQTINQGFSPDGVRTYNNYVTFSVCVDVS